ncbi:hypothetical protein Q7P36_002917 [Cladosporium allicinum]
MLGLWTIRDLQRELHRFVQSICFFLEPPEVAVDTLKFEPVRTAAVKVAIEAGWIEGLSDGCPHTSSELVRPGQSEDLLIRIFRVLTSTRLVTEVARHTYTANARTRLLLRPGVQAGISSWFDNMAPSFLHFPSYFASTNYAEPTSQSTGPYAQVFGTTYWDRLTSTPKLKMDLDNYMAAHKKGGSSLVDLLPHSRLVEGYNPAFSPTLLVDIGGGVGHQCKDLKARYPSLPGEVVVQDLQCAKDLELAGIRGMAYDFFEAQPVRDARFYYYSAILHDWPDAGCVKILSNVADAMRPGYSRLLINGIILRETQPTYFEACKDLGMMAAMSAKERTMSQLIALAAEARLEYVGEYVNEKADNGIVEFEKRRLIGDTKEVF